MAITVNSPEATPMDPNSGLHGEGRHPSTGDRDRKGEIGTVLAYQADRYTATVRTERGRVLQGVPRLRTVPGDVSALSEGMQVLLSFDYGQPIIMGILPMPATRETEGSFSVTGESPDPEAQSRLEVGNYRSATEPQDLVPGDQGISGPDGNSIAVLGGGTNVMRSSPLSQIRTHSLLELVEIFSRNYRHITDMGEFNISNNDGRINMSFRGGSDQRNETGADEENWSIKMDLGSEGDMFNFELTTPRGQTLFKMHVDAEGKLELFGLNGVDIQSGAANDGIHQEEHRGNSSSTFHGDRDTEIAGLHNRVSGNVREEVEENLSQVAGNDLFSQALRDMSIGSGRNFFVTAGGDDDSDEPAMTFDVLSGSWVTTVGNATNPGGSYNVSTVSGDMKFISERGGDIKITTKQGNIKSESKQIILKTSMTDSVILGGDNLRSHLVKWEELKQHLDILYNALDRHTHQIPGTATAASMFTVSGTTGIPVIPIGAPIKSQFSNFKSTKAGVSG